TLRSVSTICESPAGPSVFWSISRSRKSSGSVSSRGLGFANRLRRRPWRGRYYVVCPSFVHPFPGHYTRLVEHDGQQGGRIQSVARLRGRGHYWFSRSASARRSWISSSERTRPSGI